MKTIMGGQAATGMWVTIIVLAVSFLSPAMARARQGVKGSAEDISRCVADPAGCAGRLGVAPSLLTFVELKGRISGEVGDGFEGTAVKVGWDSSRAPEDCRRVVETLLAGQNFTTSSGGKYSIFVPACGSITYTLTPDNPEFSWIPASRSVRVSGASSGVAVKSGGTASGKEAATGGKAAAADAGGLVKGNLEGAPDTGEMAQIDPVKLTAEGRDFDALSGDEDTSKGPLGGTPTPGYAALERSAVDALWRATTGCNSLADPMGLPSPAELAACSDKSVSQRLGSAEQGRNDFNTIFGIGGSTSGGLTSRAAGDRGLPTLTTDSNGNPVLPSKEDTLAYLQGKKNEFSDDEEKKTGPGFTQKEAEEKISLLGKVIQAVGKIFDVGVLEDTGEEIDKAAPGLAKAGTTYRTGHFTQADAIGKGIHPDPISDQPYQYSAKECEAICNGTSASNTQRQQCGCDDQSQGVKNPSGTDSGSGTMGMTAVDAKDMQRKKTAPLVHTTEPVVDQEPVAINDLNDGGKGPKPAPEKNSKK